MITSLRLRFLAASMMGLLILPPSLATAGPDEAAEYYEEASKAYDAGKFDRAADLLERAYAEESNLIYQYNRVLALQAMGEYKEALNVLDVYENPMREDGRFEDVKEIRAEIEEARQNEVAGRKQEETAPRDIAQEEDEPKDSDALDEAPEEDGPNILAWSLVGTGVVGLGMSGLFGSTLLISDVADRKDCMQPDNTFEASCYEEDGFSSAEEQRDQFNEDRDTWETHQTLTWVFLGVGSAALIGGGVLLITDMLDADETQQSPESAGAEVGLSPYVGADGAGGSLRISF